MDTRAEAAASAQSDSYLLSGGGSLRPDLHQDHTFAIMKAKLEYHFPELKELQRPELSAPRPAQTPKVYLASDSGILRAVQAWVDGLRNR